MLVNFLEETREFLDAHEMSLSDVLYVADSSFTFFCSVVDFQKLANYEYNNEISSKSVFAVNRGLRMILSDGRFLARDTDNRGDAVVECWSLQSPMKKTVLPTLFNFQMFRVDYLQAAMVRRYCYSKIVDWVKGGNVNYSSTPDMLKLLLSMDMAYFLFKQGPHHYWYGHIVSALGITSEMVPDSPCEFLEPLVEILMIGAEGRSYIPASGGISEVTSSRLDTLGDGGGLLDLSRYVIEVGTEGSVEDRLRGIILLWVDILQRDLSFLEGAFRDGTEWDCESMYQRFVESPQTFNLSDHEKLQMEKIYYGLKPTPESEIFLKPSEETYSSFYDYLAKYNARAEADFHKEDTVRSFCDILGL